MILPEIEKVAEALYELAWTDPDVIELTNILQDNLKTPWEFIADDTKDFYRRRARLVYEAIQKVEDHDYADWLASDKTIPF